MPPQDARGALQGLSEAFARDLGPAAGELKKLLDLPDAELADGARELMGRLDDLLPSDPETAAVLAEEMARAFADGAGEGSDERRVTSDERGAALENEDQARGKSTPESNSGSFVKAGGGSGKDLTAGDPEKLFTDKRGREHSESAETERKRTCREALEKYRASTDHPSADDVASGKVPLHTALEKGFEARFGGQKVVFFTKQKTLDKYGSPDHYEPSRVDLIPSILPERGNMFPQPHSGDQVAIIERRTTANAKRKRYIIVVDKATGVETSIMDGTDEYIRKHFPRR